MESGDGPVACEPGCLVLESDFMLSGELEFGDSEIMGLDRDGGQLHTNTSGCISDGKTIHIPEQFDCLIDQRLFPSSDHQNKSLA